MTIYGKLNVLGMLALLAAAAANCWISFPGDVPAVLSVLSINLVLALLAGGISALLISGKLGWLAAITYGLLALLFGFLFWRQGLQASLLMTAVAVGVGLALSAGIASLLFRLLIPGVLSPSSGPFIGLWPTLIPVTLGVVWYLWRALLPEQVAPQRELIAAPQYLLLGILILGVVCWGGCRAVRRPRAEA